MGIDQWHTRESPGTDLPLRAKHLRFRTPRGIRAGSYGRFDFIGKKHAEAEALANGDDLLFALILAVNMGDASNMVMNYHSLLVTPVEGEEGKNMRRVGFLVQEIESLGVDEARSSRTIVTLV